MAEQTEHLDALRASMEGLARRNDELRRLLLDAHENLVARDEEIERLQRRMVEEIRRREQEIADKNGEIDYRGRVIEELRAAVARAERALEENRQTIAAMEQTRAWRAGQRLWSARERMRRRGR
jgi:predicted RNase H-like nuclease (RuvC/YqgF family)